MPQPTRSSRLRLVHVLLVPAAIGILVAGLFATRRLTAQAVAPAFTPGNVVVVRMGDGSAALSSAATAVFLDEFSTSGAPAQALPLPTATSGANFRFTDSGSATSDGGLNRSTDGRYLALAGYDASLGTAGVVASAAARVIARVAANGTIDTTTTTDGYAGNNIRSAITDDGSRFWTSGTAGGTGGTRFVAFGASAGLQIISTLTNTRAVGIFGGQLFTSSASGAFQGVSSVGGGLPTTSGQTTTILPGFPTASGPSPYGFVLLDRDAGVAGLDTAYVADDRSAASGGGIQKWTFNGAAWSLAYTLPVGSGSSGGARGLTADSSGANVILYATTTESAANRLVTVIDTGAASPFTTIATAAANTAFRGVAFAPVTAGGTTPTVSLSVSTSSASEAAQTAVTVTATASSAVSGDQTVTLGVSGTNVTAGDYTLSDTTITIPNGQTTGSVTFTVVDDRLAEGTETARLTIGNPSAGIALGSPTTQDITITDNDALAVCSAAHVAINVVQGSGNASPSVGQTVTVRGVVVGDYEGPSPALHGFYLQDLPADDDNNPASSEGIFVFESNNANSVSLGQVVQITGVVSEFNGLTELTSSNIEDCGTTASPAPIDVTLPVPAAVAGVPYLERFEGMLVRFHQTLYVTEHFQLGQFGQILMSSGGRLPQPTTILAPGAPAQAQQSANDLNKIIVDDDQNGNDPDPIKFGRGGNPLSASNTLRGGDTATDIVGVVTFDFADYHLRPINALGGGVPNFQPTNPRPAAPPGVGGRLKVVGMNVLNYFLTLDTGSSSIICGPIGNKQQCRGANTATELSRQQQKLNAALVKLSPDVFGFSELENTQSVATGADVNPLADIIGRLNTSLGSSVYEYIDTGVIGTDTIRVGIAYKKASVTPVGSFLVDNNPVHNRPPLAQLFSENATGERFSVIANHFKSKGSCPASGADADQGDGQGCWNAVRTQQATALVSFINTVITTTGDRDVLLVGDFNSYAKEDPIRTLENAGFTNLIARYSGASAYSYVFDGEWGYLDHGLASASLLPQVANAGDYHINADEPTELDYNTEFKSAGQITSMYAADEYRISDHDPVLVGLALSPPPQGNADHFTAEAGTTLTVNAAGGVLANDTGGPLSILGYTSTAHGTLTFNADGSFSYTPTPGYTGPDTFNYAVSNATRRYSLQVASTALPPLATLGGVNITAGAFGSALVPVPNDPGAVYGLTDRGPNVDGPSGTKVEPIPAFVPSIGKFRIVGSQALLEAIIPLHAPDGTPYSGRVSSVATTGETITDLNGNVLPADPNGYDPEGLVALPDGTFWVSDEYGPFITHFDATGKQDARLSPFDASLPVELRNRIVNRGMEGLTITPDGSMLVGSMQSALQQVDLSGFDAKKLTPLRIVTYALATGQVHEYVYLLDDPNTTKTAVSEITALSSTMFLVDERDGNYPPGAYKKLFLIDISGATDVGPNSTVGGAAYQADGPFGGLLVGGKTIENLLRNGSTPQDTAASTTTLAAAGIIPVSKVLYVDVGALLESVDPQGRVFSHDKLEGVAALNGGATLIVSNDSDFGIDGLANAAPPFQLHAKVSPVTGQQDDGEFLVIDLIRSTAAVTIDVKDTIRPDTTLTSMPGNPTNSTAAGFMFSGSDGAGSGIAGFECKLDTAAFGSCSTGVVYGVGDGGHTIAVRAVDGAGNVDDTPAAYAWTVDTIPPDTTIDSGPDNPTASTTASFTFHGTDAGTGVARFECALDNAQFGVCSSGVSYNGLAIGGHLLEVRAVDAAGNADATPAGYPWTIGNATSPAIAIDNIPAGPEFGGSFAPTYAYAGNGLTWTASSTPDICRVSLNGTVRFVGVGTCTLTAHATATFRFPKATGIPQSFMVEQASTTIAVRNIPLGNSARTGGRFTPTYKYFGDGVPSVTSTTLTTCTVSGNVVHFTSSGTCTLTASATAGINFAASIGAPQSFTIR